MPWKTTEISKIGEEAQRFAVISEDGNPVWLEDDGSENPINWPHARKKIDELIRGEKKTREKLQETENGYATFREKFKDIEDPVSAAEAQKTVQNLKDKKLIESGEVEQLKAKIKEVYEQENTTLKQKVAETEKLMRETIGAKDGEIYKLIVSNRFMSSPYIKEKLILPADITEQVFGKYFKVEDGKPVGYYTNGDKIYSNKNAGEFADFDEALSILIEKYPNKDHILKGNNQSGGGKPPEGSGSNKTYKTIEDFTNRQEKLDYIDKYGKEAWQKIVDAK